MERTPPTNGARASAATGSSSPNPNPNHNHADRTRRTTGRGGGGGGRRPQLEGVLSKYTNLIQGWQNRYFVLDEELKQLQYFVNEQGRSQKPRGTLPLIGASVTVSDEAPHMFVVSSANGELFKLRAPRRAKHTHAQPDTLLEVREVIVQAECQQKSLVHSIELLPRRGGVSCLDQDLLLLKATSAATLRCLAQCLNMLQQHRHAHNMSDSAQPQAPPSEECDVDDVKTAGFQGPLLSEDQTNPC
ncbi:hypothetical protein PHYPO_G00239240 [Pangasianodon hypophthalmus]|uniref:PH domain-containing protein n=1 Tax=Pangasianodon hypophthalmus TaxID=310915 RepID=A0A5N5NFG0_PANHP|nr:hypothetical protein PHYPO_G00239240 [Pangasianodon hypophthalmus]